ncbi:IS66 family insertion sequence element accessory protein TnpB, partial [Hyalangium minutum]|uniref:IS66 family insertion sequence element accessory protein TnpB n=1 Tax=Hyalangium minutum TaxID=394096 RepID=UPI003B8378C2
MQRRWTCARGLTGSAALVEQQLGGQVLKGDVFLFVGRSRRPAKVLYFDGTGLVLLTKRLFWWRAAATRWSLPSTWPCRSMPFTCPWHASSACSCVRAWW